MPVINWETICVGRTFICMNVESWRHHLSLVPVLVVTRDQTRGHINVHQLS